MTWIKINDKAIGLINKDFRIVIAIKGILKRSGGARYKALVYGADCDISAVPAELRGEWADIENLKLKCELYFKQKE